MKWIDSSVQALASVPFEPGNGPFRVKGVAYRGHLAYVDRFVPGGNAAVMGAMARPALSRFFEQPFLAASRYDVFPLAQAGIGCAKVTGLSFYDFVRVRASWQAREDLNGVYRMMLNLASPDMVIARVPKLMAQYFDFGTADSVVTEPRHVSGVRAGIPFPVAGWLAAVGHGYLEEVLRVLGARDAKMVQGEPRIVGELHGVQLVDVAYDLRW